MLAKYKAEWLKATGNSTGFDHRVRQINDLKLLKEAREKEVLAIAQDIKRLTQELKHVTNQRVKQAKLKNEACQILRSLAVLSKK